MAANTGVGLTAQEFYYWAQGAEDLEPVTRNIWTPNHLTTNYIQVARLCSDSRVEDP